MMSTQPKGETASFVPLTHIVQGYEIERDMKLDDEAIYILATLARKGVVYLESFTPITIGQLQDASNCGYFDVIQLGGRVWVVESERFRLEL